MKMKMSREQFFEISKEMVTWGHRKKLGMKHIRKDVKKCYYNKSGGWMEYAKWKNYKGMQ